MRISRAAWLIFTGVALLAGCGDRESSFRTGVALGSTVVSYPVVATIVASPEGSEVFLLNLEDKSTAWRRPFGLDVNGIQRVPDKPGSFLMTASKAGQQQKEFSVIEYSHLDSREDLIWRRSEFLGHPFRLGDSFCAMRSDASTPKGFRTDLSPVCDNVSFSGISISVADNDISSELNVVFLDSYQKRINIIMKNGESLLDVYHVLPIENFPYGFFFGKRFFVSGSNIDKRVFEVVDQSLVEERGPVAARLAASFQSRTDQVLFMDEHRTVLFSGRYDDSTVTYTLVDAGGQKVFGYQLDLTATH